MVAAGLWIAFRAVGGFGGERWAASVSSLMLIMTAVLATTGVAHVPVWLSRSIVAPIVWTAMLGILLVVDFLDCRKRSHADLSLVERRKRDGRSLKLAIAGLFFAWGLGVPMLTLIHQLSGPQQRKAEPEEMSFIEHAGFRCGEALVTVSFFALGCNIGSFLNVVVWRMPLGKSIVRGDSCCPVCSAKIAGRDNIPIFGWLGLGGQCRACHTEISSRYPIVEAVTGTVFLLLYFVELISGGANLPVRGINMYRGVLWIIMYPKWDVIGLYLYHCYLFSLLLVLTLMTLDRSRIPRRFLVLAFTGAMGLPVLVQGLALVPVWPTIHVAPVVGSGLCVTAGAVVGILAGAALHWALREKLRQEPNELFAIVPAFGLIGTVLGWQAVLSIMIVFCGLMIVRMTLIGRCDRALSHLFVAVLLHHAIWRAMSEWSGAVWPHAGSGATAVILPVLMLALCLVIRRASTFSFSENFQRSA